MLAAHLAPSTFALLRILSPCWVLCRAAKYIALRVNNSCINYLNDYNILLANYPLRLLPIYQLEMARALQFHILLSAINFIKTTANQDSRKLSASVHTSAPLQLTGHQKRKSITGENWPCKFVTNLSVNA